MYHYTNSDQDTICIDTAKPLHEDSLSYQTYLDTVKFDGDHYSVSLPWKVDCPSLHNSQAIAFGQLKGLIKNLKSKGEESHICLELIQNQMEKKIIERVTSASLTGVCHYLSHHAVKKASATISLCTVFNCIAKKGHCLSINYLFYERALPYRRIGG